MDLIIPVEKPQHKNTVRDIRISEHNDWQRQLGKQFHLLIFPVRSLNIIWMNFVHFMKKNGYFCGLQHGNSEQNFRIA
jgi:hypothetical protein